MKRTPAGNMVLPKAGLNGFDWAFVQGSTAVILLNFSAKIPAFGNTRTVSRNHLTAQDKRVNKPDMKNTISAKPFSYPSLKQKRSNATHKANASCFTFAFAQRKNCHFPRSLPLYAMRIQCCSKTRKIINGLNSNLQLLKSIAMTLLNLIILCFVSLVSLGQIPSEILEFKNGHTKKFTSDGSGKSKGLKFSLKYPQSYRAQEGERPNVVQTFLNSNHDCDIIVIVMKLPQAYSTSEKRDLLSKQSMQDMLPETAKLIGATDGLIVEGEPAGFVESYLLRKVVAGDQTLTLRLYSRMYCIIYKDFLIQINFGVGSGSLREQTLKQKFDSYKSLFSYVVNSFILVSKWQQ